MEPGGARNKIIFKQFDTPGLEDAKPIMSGTVKLCKFPVSQSVTQSRDGVLPSGTADDEESSGPTQVLTRLSFDGDGVTLGSTSTSASPAATCIHTSSLEVKVVHKRQGSPRALGPSLHLGRQLVR